MIVDFHVHLSSMASRLPAADQLARSFAPENGYDEVLDQNGDATGENYVAYMDRVGVDYSVIVTTAFTRDYVKNTCRGQKRLLPFYTITPGFGFRPEIELKEAVVKEGFKGLKLYPTYLHFYPNDIRLYPVYAVAQELGIPVMFHTGSSVFPGSRIKYGNPVYMDDLAVDFPELKIVMAHSGRGFWYQEAFFLAKLHANVYMEVSGLPVKKLLDLFPELERVAHKVIFGSDWPASPGPAQMIRDFLGLPISDEAKALILGENAARILNIG